MLEGLGTPTTPVAPMVTLGATRAPVGDDRPGGQAAGSGLDDIDNGNADDDVYDAYEGAEDA